MNAFRIASKMKKYQFLACHDGSRQIVLMMDARLCLQSDSFDAIKSQC